MADSNSLLPDDASGSIGCVVAAGKGVMAGTSGIVILAKGEGGISLVASFPLSLSLPFPLPLARVELFLFLLELLVRLLGDCSSHAAQFQS